MLPVSLLKSALMAVMRPVWEKIWPLASRSPTSAGSSVLRQALLVVEVLGLADVEVDPHLASVREGREQLALFEQAAPADLEPVEHAVEGGAHLGQVEVDPSQRLLGIGLAEAGLRQRELVGRHDLVIPERLRVLELDAGHLGLGRRPLQLRPVHPGA